MCIRDRYEGETCIGTLKKELTFFKPKYNIDFNGWHVEGDVFEWDYTKMCIRDRFSSAGRAPALQAGGQGFDSLNLHHMGQ